MFIIYFKKFKNDRSRDEAKSHHGSFAPKRARRLLRVAAGGAAFLPRRGVGGGVVDDADESVDEAEDAANGEEPVSGHPALRHSVRPVRQRAQDQQRHTDDQNDPD
jgi:hypothetical protein